MTSPITMAVVCPPGLEFTTDLELKALGYERQSCEPGLREVSGGLEDIYRLNLHLRTASRILVRLGQFNAAAFSELHKKAVRLPWSNYLQPGQPVTIRVSTQHSRLYHKKGIAERVSLSISEALGRPVVSSQGAEEDQGDTQLIVVRLFRNICSISIDSSGAHLHRRGYRQAVAKAPLRENLAAAIVIASGWKGRVPLVDPFCGSGTIPIEAALIAAGRPPGLQRRFAFEDWPVFSPGTWQRLKDAVSASVTGGMPVIAGSDRDAGAIKAAEANAGRAGVGGLVRWSRQSISELELPGDPGWIITNPPYGERVGGGPDLRNLYARTGSVWRERAGMWHIYLLSSSPKWTGQLGLPCHETARFDNGGIAVRLVRAGVGSER